MMICILHIERGDDKSVALKKTQLGPLGEIPPFREQRIDVSYRLGEKRNPEESKRLVLTTPSMYYYNLGEVWAKIEG